MYLFFIWDKIQSVFPIVLVLNSQFNLSVSNSLPLYSEDV